MKKLAAILLLSLLLFNWIGYQIYTAVAEDQANHELISRLDKQDYILSELISIKVPHNHLSPYTSEGNFERMDGQIDYRGVIYNFVQRRFTEDSIELLCIPNHQASQIRSAKADFFKLVSDLPPGGAKKSGSSNMSYKCFNGEYIPETIFPVVNFNDPDSPEKNGCYLVSLFPVFLPIGSQPPESIA